MIAMLLPRPAFAKTIYWHVFGQGIREYECWHHMVSHVSHILEYLTDVSKSIPHLYVDLIPYMCVLSAHEVVR
jgi:hypothetical protein